MRRTRPDKRQYQACALSFGACGDPTIGKALTIVQCAQVVVAVDDSRSMAETGNARFALEALTLICKAMARLEVWICECSVRVFLARDGGSNCHVSSYTALVNRSC
jgi:hypothetical protein